ncbi:hypothetical protein EI94DRAFT_1799599 [Lactarius quietus]|nr:hypothetical protein EI94DRAFT_1799599 [Lactarius quietus]
MARVAEDDMEHQYSVSPPVSSIPLKRTHSAPDPMESEEDVPDADIPSSSSSDSNPDIPSPILSHNEPLDSGGPSTLSPQIGQRTAERNVTHEDRLQNPPSVDVPKRNAPYVLRAAFGGHVTFSRIGTEMRTEGRKRQKMPEDRKV